jgi:hypothetical protein
VKVRIGDLVIRERRGQSTARRQVVLPKPARHFTDDVVPFPLMESIDADSVSTLVRLWSCVQQDEPRSVLSPWFVHTCHGRISTVDLVVRYQWKVDTAPVYSLFGRHALTATATQLLAGIRQLGHEPIVHQISSRQAEMLRSMPGLLIDREPERDEYILDTSRHSALEGHAYKHLRYSIRHLTEQHRGRIVVRMVDTADPSELEALEARVLSMPNSSQVTGNDNGAWESACLLTFLHRPIGRPVQIFTIEIAGTVRGIGVFEAAIDRDAVVFHILRTDSRYEGLVDFGVWALAQAAARQGFTELNLEEDLGIPGLRAKKQHLHPARMIKHFTMRPSALT